MCTCIVNQRQNQPTEQPTNNGWGVGSRTYNESQQRPQQRNGWGNTQQRGRWQQRPMGTGGNELPLGRELRMTLPQSEETVASEGPKSAQRSEPQSSITSGGSSVRTPPVSLDKGANKPTKSEQKAASKAVRKEKAREKNIAEEKPQRESLPNDVKVSIHFVCTREFHHNLPRLWKSRKRGILKKVL